MLKDITVVDTNYTEYALVLKHKVFNREYTQVALYGETQVLFWLFLPFRVVCFRSPAPQSLFSRLQAAHQEFATTFSRSLRPLVCPKVYPKSPFWFHLQQVNIHLNM